MAVVNPNRPPNRIPLTRMLILGVMKGISDYFEVPPERVIPISTTDRMKVAQKAAERYNQGNMVFPQILIYITEFARGDQDASNTYNPRALMRNGVYTKMSDDENRVQRLHISPCNIGIEVIYQTNDYFQGIDYATRWMNGGLRKRLNFTLTYMNFPLDIHVDLAPSLQIPEMDASIDIPNYYEYDSGLIVHGFLEDQEHDDEDQVQMLRQTVTGVSVVADAVAAANQLEDPNEFSTVR